MKVSDIKPNTKLALALEVYQANIPAQDTMTKREFRAMVTDQMRNALGIPNAPYGTIGYYFATAQQLVTHNRRRYVRSDPSKKTVPSPSSAQESASATQDSSK